jgi:DNA-binding MarR family transcriptional regulator
MRISSPILISSTNYIIVSGVKASEIRQQAERLYVFVQHFGRRLREIDAQLDLSPARFSVLASLVFHGRANVGELAAFERVRRPSMTRLVRDMERADLVRRNSDPSDGRGVLVEATTKGRSFLERARRRKIEIVRQHLQAEDPGVRRALAAVLDSLDRLADEKTDSSIEEVSSAGKSVSGHRKRNQGAAAPRRATLRLARR